MFFLWFNIIGAKIGENCIFVLYFSKLYFPKVYFSKVYGTKLFQFEVYPTCVSSKRCAFIWFKTSYSGEKVGCHDCDRHTDENV